MWTANNNLKKIHATGAPSTSLIATYHRFPPKMSNRAAERQGVEFPRFRTNGYVRVRITVFTRRSEFPRCNRFAFNSAESEFTC